ncbi:hypothetical protein JCM15519_11720 [Fundidesulfovibrio butyratiphilus]
MRAPLNRSLRTSLIFLVLLAVLPALAIIGYSGMELRERILAERTDDSLRLVESLAHTLAETAFSIERILTTLSVLPPIRSMDPAQSAEILDRVRSKNLLLSNALLLRPDGEMTASASHSEIRDFSDSPFVRRAMTTGRFTCGRYMISRVTGEPILPFVYPILDDAGQVQGVLTAGLRISSLNRLFGALELPPQAIFSIIDGDGVRISRKPVSASAPQPGKSLTAYSVWKCASMPNDQGFYEARGSDNTVRVYAYAKLRLHGETSPYMYLVVSTPKAFMGREALAAVQRNMALLTLAGMLALAMAWMIGENLLVLPLRRIAETAQRIGQGDLEARTGAPCGVTETRTLAEAVDSMARTLEKRQTERDRAESALRASEERFRQIADSMADWIWETDAGGAYTYCSSRIQDILGYSHEEMIGRPFLSLMAGEGYETAAVELRSLHARKAPIREMEVRRRTKRGSQVRTVVNGVPVLDASGALVGYRGIERDISRRKVLEDQLESMSLTDALTGLPNRNLIVERLRQAQARAKRLEGFRFAVLFVDVDRFKTINDSLGHLAGDKVLRQTAARLVESVRELDTVARYGADEFVILLEEIASPRLVTRVVRRIMESMKSPLTISDGREARLSVSVGMLLDSGGGDTPENLIRKADIAMYQAKARGGGRFQVYVPKMLAETERRLRLEQNLDSAVAENQLFLHYQPIVDLQSGLLAGAEALVRWNHPERGLVMPGEFIPLAEQSGRITALERWVLDRACRDMADWRSRYPKTAAPSVSVNLSVRHLENQHLVSEISQCLKTYGIEPRQLVLEITETSLLHIDLGVLSKLDALRSMGVRLAMDDFGTGYSSLAYLQRLPLDELKVDLQFVRHLATNPENKVIVRSIVALGGGLGLTTLAEGVETEEQRAILLELGCQLGQGYLFSKPVSAELFAERWFGLDAAGKPQTPSPEPKPTPTNPA